MLPGLLIDTSSWRNAVLNRAWLRRASDLKVPIVLTSEVARELVVSALVPSSDAEFEEVRAACVLVTRYATETTRPAEWHFASVAGVRLEGPNPLRLCEVVAECRASKDMAARSKAQLYVGGGRDFRLSDAARIMREEKATWARSIRNAIDGVHAGLPDARKRQHPVTIPRVEYERIRGQWLTQADAFVDYQIARTQNTLGDELPSGWDTADARQRIREALQAHVAIHAEAILDCFDHPFNANRRKVRLEGNDWYDLAQTRYLAEDRIWVTDDRRWIGIGEQARTPGRIVSPSGLALA